MENISLIEIHSVFFYLNAYISACADPQMFPHYQTSINYIEATLQTTKTFSLNSAAANVIQAQPVPIQAFFASVQTFSMICLLISTMNPLFRPPRALRACWSLSYRDPLPMLRPWGFTSSCLSTQPCRTPRITSASPFLWQWPSCGWTPTPAKSWVQ